ncbi:unnamed protein product [Wuchereria bancrofti]|uniref:Uncharacterized protein n=1 Tax=Wuchereria bancrofti TaxID=6293 RepID=A0A3P7F2B0_WUCBA|nr:unnamed protein product [Wuchereria bancrofti]
MSQNQTWYSIIDYLYVKTNNGAFSLKLRKRMFFALEECKNLLISCNDEMDFVEQKLLKQIVLDHAACTLGKNSEAQFIIQEQIDIS